MTQLEKLKALLGSPPESDSVLQFYLDNASDIICDLRDSSSIETKYLTVQIKIAIELYNKRGAEGETGHSENGISRSYEKSDISQSTLGLITPIAKTPFSSMRVV